MSYLASVHYRPADDSACDKRFVTFKELHTGSRPGNRPPQDKFMITVKIIQRMIIAVVSATMCHVSCQPILLQSITGGPPGDSWRPHMDSGFSVAERHVMSRQTKVRSKLQIHAPKSNSAVFENLFFSLPRDYFFEWRNGAAGRQPAQEAPSRSPGVGSQAP